MALSTLFSLFRSRSGPLRPRHPPYPERDCPEAFIMQAHGQRASQYLRDARDIAAFEARMKSLQSERGWW